MIQTMSGNYAPFIISAYALTALSVAALTIWVVTDYRRQQSMLRDLEARGISRRSDRSSQAS